MRALGGAARLPCFAMSAAHRRPPAPHPASIDGEEALGILARHRLAGHLPHLCDEALGNGLPRLASESAFWRGPPAWPARSCSRSPRSAAATAQRPARRPSSARGAWWPREGARGPPGCAAPCSRPRPCIRQRPFVMPGARQGVWRRVCAPQRGAVARSPDGFPCRNQPRVLSLCMGFRIPSRCFVAG
jgi:hypothetical protein